MPRKPTEPQVLSVGQLAKRWAIGTDRVQRLIDAGKIPRVFRVPAAGKFGQATRIPLDAVLEVEERWQLSADSSAPKRKLRRTGAEPSLRNLPNIIGPDRSRDDESHEDDLD